MEIARSASSPAAPTLKQNTSEWAVKWDVYLCLEHAGWSSVWDARREIMSACFECVSQRASKSTICSRSGVCAERALLSSSGAISCSHPSFGISAPWEREHNTRWFLLLYIFNKVFMSACHCKWSCRQSEVFFMSCHWFTTLLLLLLLLLLFMLIFWEVGYFTLTFMCFFPPLCSPPPFTFHSRQLSLVQLDCFVRAHHLHSD